MRKMFFVQGAIYFISGIWPVVHMASFVAITGPKTDLWLVNTVGSLLAATGVALLLESRAELPSKNLALLAMLQSAVLTTIDIYYVSKGVIGRVYLADAAMEVGLILLWLAVWRRSNPSRT